MSKFNTIFHSFYCFLALKRHGKSVETKPAENADKLGKDKKEDIEDKREDKKDKKEDKKDNKVKN